MHAATRRLGESPKPQPHGDKKQVLLDDERPEQYPSEIHPDKVGVTQRAADSPIGGNATAGTALIHGGLRTTIRLSAEHGWEESSVASLPGTERFDGQPFELERDGARGLDRHL